MPNANSAAKLKLATGFYSLRDALSAEKYLDRVNRPLAFWTLPNDRRLPLALLDRSLADVLATRFEDLAATPGIGEKKIHTLLVLLRRAAQDQVAPFEDDLDGSSTEMNVSCLDAEGRFDATVVSEAMWAEWQSTVARQNLGSEPLGRLTPSLQEMPTVIWHTPLGTYRDVTLAEMRAMKIHGEKRVRLVLEVFHILHRLLSKATTCDHLEVSLRPMFVQPIEKWIRDNVGRDEKLTLAEIRENVIRPMVEQIKIDAGHTVYLLAQERLGLNGPPISVRTQSRRMDVTRARIYQLLDDCAKIMEVRWPEGKLMFGEIERTLEKQRLSEEELIVFDGIRDLFFPKQNANLRAPEFV